MVDNESFTINPQVMTTEYKGIAILEILKGEFKEQNLSRLKIISHLIAAISLTQTICLWGLCEIIPLKTKIISIKRRLQRFISEVVLDFEITALFLFKICGVKNDVYLILDRTNWKHGQKNINILMLALSWNGKSIPIFWKPMKKRRNSNEEERLEVLKKFKKVFPSVKISGLLVDREFIGEKWL